MSTLPDYSGVSQRQTESPALPYESPNLPDKTKKAINYILLAYFGLLVSWF